MAGNAKRYGGKKDTAGRREKDNGGRKGAAGWREKYGGEKDTAGRREKDMAGNGRREKIRYLKDMAGKDTARTSRRRKIWRELRHTATTTTCHMSRGDK